MTSRSIAITRLSAPAWPQTGAEELAGWMYFGLAIGVLPRIHWAVAPTSQEAIFDVIWPKERSQKRKVAPYNSAAAEIESCNPCHRATLHSAKPLRIELLK